MRLNAWGAYGVDNFVCEAADQEAAGFFVSDAAAPEIEEAVFVNLAAGGTVAALDVVGVDPEGWLDVNLGAVGEEEVFVFLLCVDLLGVLLDNNAAVEGGAGTSTEDALV